VGKWEQKELHPFYNRVATISLHHPTNACGLFAIIALMSIKCES